MESASISNSLHWNNFVAAVIAEKNRQIDDLRRQIERNLKQNRLANLEQGGNRSM
jgi:hypothetical protein